MVLLKWGQDRQCERRRDCERAWEGSHAAGGWEIHQGLAGGENCSRLEREGHFLHSRGLRSRKTDTFQCEGGWCRRQAVAAAHGGGDCCHSRASRQGTFLLRCRLALWSLWASRGTIACLFSRRPATIRAAALRVGGFGLSSFALAGITALQGLSCRTGFVRGLLLKLGPNFLLHDALRLKPLGTTATTRDCCELHLQRQREGVKSGITLLGISMLLVSAHRCYQNTLYAGEQSLKQRPSWGLRPEKLTV